MTTDDEKPAKGTRCCTRVHSGGYVRGRQCAKAAKIIRDGKPYCGMHDPVAIKARKDKRNEGWEERWAANRAARDAIFAANAERDRRAECFDDLLEALAEIVGYAGGAETALDDEYVMERVHAAIAKARGME